MANVLYLSVVDDLKKKITSGEILPDKILKSESKLMEEYSVSRMTLRKSLSLLSNEGYIYSVPGKGYFVRKPDTDIYQFRFNEYDSFLPDVEKIKLLSVKIDKPTEEMIDNFVISKDEQVVKIERLIFSNKEPVAYEIFLTPYIPNKPVVEDKLSFANYYKALEMKLPFSIKNTIEMKLVLANEIIADKLKIQEREYVFKVTKKTYKKDNNNLLNYSYYYIKPNYFILFAKTPEEDESKKIF